MSDRESRTTEKADKGSSKASKAEASSSKPEAKVKARPEASVVPAPSVSIQLSEEAATSKGSSKKEIKNDSSD